MKGMLITKRKYPWLGEQTWHDILFLHWKVEPETIRAFVPKPFVLDSFEGDTWISVVVFQAKNSLVRGMPNWTSFTPVTQINARTYVYHSENHERGVYFFALRVDSLLAAVGARTLFGLPFHQTENF